MKKGTERREISFLEHLSELRVRLVYCIVAVVIAAGVAYYFREAIYSVLILPLLRAEPGIKLNYFSPTEPFFVYLRISLFSGLLLATPLVLYQLWAFIGPGLTRRERRAVLAVLPLVLALFIGGVLFVYFILLPVSLKFLIGFAHQQLEPELNQDRYFGFITALCLAGGLLFELPAVLGLLGYLDLVQSGWLFKRTGHAMVLLMILAAVITPTGDAFNMLVLTAPLLMLYLVSVFIVWLIQRRKVKTAENRV